MKPVKLVSVGSQMIGRPSDEHDSPELLPCMSVTFHLYLAINSCFIFNLALLICAISFCIFNFIVRSCIYVHIFLSVC